MWVVTFFNGRLLSLCRCVVNILGSTKDSKLPLVKFLKNDCLTCEIQKYDHQLNHERIPVCDI